jgi:hypothetical protein
MKPNPTNSQSVLQKETPKEQKTKYQFGEPTSE